MAELLKRKFDLLAFRIAMDVSGENPMVDVELQGRDRGELGLVAHWSIAAAAIGVPERLDRSARAYEGYAFSFPDDVLDEIKEAVDQTEYQDRPLWLHLARPLGYLNLVPWEQLLQPPLGMPILRLPDFVANPPRESSHKFEVALCGSVPRAKSEFTAVDHLTGITEFLLATGTRRTSVHVFADADLYAELSERVANRGLADVHVHDPQAAAEFRPAERKLGTSGTGRVQNPWLLWMREALGGRSVDMVQFLTHGYLSRDFGALAFAESPLQNLDRSVARFVDASELMAFLTQVGAWSVAFSSPEHNYSEMGLRLIADTIAQLRAGPVLHHEMRLDMEKVALADAYRFLFGGGHFPPPRSPALLTYCHPSLLEPAEARPRRRRTRGSAPTPEEVISETYAQADFVPSWVGSSQRYIEQRRRELESMQCESDSTDASSLEERMQQARVIEDTLDEIEIELGNVITSKRFGDK